jgi:hypothetical protein
MVFRSKFRFEPAHESRLLSRWKMKKGIIFSKDRAMQLDATISSFINHCRDANDICLVVIYKTSTTTHAQQYLALSKFYSGISNVKFIPQNSFREDVLGFLSTFPRQSFSGFLYRLLPKLHPRLAGRLYKFLPQPINQDFILFLVDDNIFTRDFTVKDTTIALEENPDALCFSLRLGYNTTYCYVHDVQQPLPSFETLGHNTLKFSWTSASEDFGYPLEVSSSIYRLKDIQPLLMSIPFNNPNLLEGHLSIKAPLFAYDLPEMLCFKNSVTFSNPLNIVQNISRNRTGGIFQYSTEELAKLFEEGYRVKIDAYRDFIPNSCHQEVNLIFEKR